MKTLKPFEIVAALDTYVIGQHNAKRAVAVALRNRWRRQQVPAELRDEIAPKNIILIGPTGVGKTEIARRLSILTDSPFHKVEASKFTEVGYVGRDVESMVRELLEQTITLRQGPRAGGRPGQGPSAGRRAHAGPPAAEGRPGAARALDRTPATRRSSSSAPARRRPPPPAKSCAALLRQGKLDNRYVDVETADRNVPDGGGLLKRGSGGAGDQLQGHARRAFPQGHEAAAAEGAGGHGRPVPGRGPAARGCRPDRQAGDREGRAGRDHLYRRNRQDRGQGSRPRPGRVARRRAAGSACRWSRAAR